MGQSLFSQVAPWLGVVGVFLFRGLSWLGVIGVNELKAELSGTNLVYSCTRIASVAYYYKLVYYKLFGVTH